MLSMRIDTAKSKGTIHKDIYGHFSEHLGRCIYEGYWVGSDSGIPNTRGIRNDVVAALKAIKVPALRWPGGCFADEYHWQDGIGPYEERPSMINVHWGGVEENNHFGTHEFFELCDLVGADPYVCGNVGSGTVQEMRQWVEYMTFDGRSPMADLRRRNGRELPWKLTYFGVGNENWGCGGNMEPEYYADLYRRYATYVRNFSANRIYRIACGPNVDNYHWTEVLMKKSARYLDGLSLHYYTVPGPSWTEKGSATSFTETEWITTLKKAMYMEELIVKHSAIMDRYDAEKRVGLIVDEWGTWYDVEPGTNPGFLYQQNTIRDALVAAMHLDTFNRHCDRVRMANLAQTVNVLQALILTERGKMIKTPTYHVFDLYQVHQNGRQVDVEFDDLRYTLGSTSVPQVSASASIDGSGRLNLTLSALNPHDAVDIELDLRGFSAKSVKGRIVTANEMSSRNTFEEPETVGVVPFNGASVKETSVRVTLPPMSVVALTFE